MSSNNGSAAATPWRRYREQRLAHTRELQAFAAAYRDAPRCAKCWIVLALRPDEPCHVADCPLALPTVDRSASATRR
jgi:hypothetical protein